MTCRYLVVKVQVSHSSSGAWRMAHGLPLTILHAWYERDAARRFGARPRDTDVVPCFETGQVFGGWKSAGVFRVGW